MWFGPVGFQQQIPAIAMTGRVLLCSEGYVIVSRRQEVTLSVQNWSKSSWDQNVHKMHIFIVFMVSPRQPPGMPHVRSPACHVFQRAPGDCLSSLKVRCRYGMPPISPSSPSSESRAPLLLQLSIHALLTSEETAFVPEQSCSFCKISSIIWGTEGKKLRVVVKWWWLNKLLGSVLAFLSCSGNYKVNLNGKVKHIANCYVCWEKIIVCV